MSIKTQIDLERMREVGKAVAITLRKMQLHARPGMSTLELDHYGNDLLQSFGATSAPKKDYGFPGYNCISVNEEACHGIPAASKILQEGDLVNIDVSAELNGYYGDNGSSFVLGEDTHHLSPLVEASRAILKAAIGQIRDGVKIADVGGFIHMQARKRGFNVIKNLCGHGIGRRLHEPPEELPNYRDRFNRGRFRKDSVIALETFISTKADQVFETEDGWSMTARDHSFVAQHEHTLIVTDGEPIILTLENGV